ncbi:PREDICTED: ubiquitin-like-specific protease, partial [Prunus dulcis]
KWKDFKSTLTRHYILPYTNDRERLSQPPETYKFIEKAQWDAFVASRLSKDFESVHSQHAQIREKLEYNHRLSRKGYAGLEDQLEETMPGDELQKQVSEGKVSVYGSNDVLTMALGPEHPGRVRGVGAGISPRQYFNLPKPQRMSFDDRLKDSLRVLLQEENKKMEAKAREEALRMEARTKQLVEAEREHFLSQLSQLIPNFDPSMLKPRISQSPKNPMSDKASCSGGDVRSLHFEDDTAKNGKHQEEKKNEGNQDEEKNEEKKDEEKEEEKKDEEKKEEKQDEKEKEDEEKHDDQTLNFTIDKEVFGLERDTFVLPEDITQFAGMEEIGATVVAVYMRYLHDLLKQANMCSMVGFIDPATVSANSGTIADRSRLVAARLQKTDGEQIFMMPYNPGRHWILLIVRAKRETVYFLDPLPGNRVVDEEGKNIVNSAIKIYNSHIARAGRKAVIWKTLSGTPKQPSSVECGYYVMRFMRDIIMDPSLAFEKKYAKGKQEAPYPQEAIDEVRNEWAEFVCLHME